LLLDAVPAVIAVPGTVSDLYLAPVTAVRGGDDRRRALFSDDLNRHIDLDLLLPLLLHLDLPRLLLDHLDVVVRHLLLVVAPGRRDVAGR
jgi:hypothetical protein